MCLKLHNQKILMLKKNLTLLFILFNLTAFAQKAAIVRGNVYDKVNGQPIPYTNVILKTNDASGSTLGVSTDLNGFYQINNVPIGSRTLAVTFIGYDSLETKVDMTEGYIYKSF